MTASKSTKKKKSPSPKQKKSLRVFQFDTTFGLIEAQAATPKKAQAAVEQLVQELAILMEGVRDSLERANASFTLGEHVH